MRKIEFKPNINGVTKIFFDDIELTTRVDPADIREYRYNRAQYTILFAEHIIETTLKKLEKEITIAPDETAAVIKYLKRELGL